MLKQAAVCALLGACAMGASAGGLVIGEFALADHPDGSAAPPLYGLRLDNVIGSGTSTLSMDHFGDTVLTVYDNGGDLSINITGTLWGGQISGHAYVSAEAYVIDMNYTVNVNPNGGGWVVAGFDAANSGSITRVSDNMSWDLFTTTDGTNAFVFRPDDHRLPTDGNDWVGRGWLSTSDTGSDSHGGNQDWLFTATEIPAPGSAMLAISGLALMARRRR